MQRIRYWALRNRKNLINIGWAALCFGSLFGILTIQLSATEEHSSTRTPTPIRPASATPSRMGVPSHDSQPLRKAAKPESENIFSSTSYAFDARQVSHTVTIQTAGHDSVSPPAPYAPPAPYGPAPSLYGAPAAQYNAPTASFGAPPAQYSAPPTPYGAPSTPYGAPSAQYGAPSGQYSAPPTQYSAPAMIADPATSPNAVFLQQQPFEDARSRDPQVMPSSNYFGRGPDDVCDEWSGYCNCRQKMFTRRGATCSDKEYRFKRRDDDEGCGCGR